MTVKFKNSKQVESLLSEMNQNLEKGKNKQVFEAFAKAVEKVKTNPTSKDFIKYDTDEYRAVDVLAQRRAFFKIYSEYNIVFFVWLNPEDFPHDSSRGDLDPCYKEFKRLLNNTKLEELVIEPEEIPEFKSYGEFRKDASFYTFLKTSLSNSGAQLQLISREESEYEIAHIHEDPYYSDSLPLLLTKVAEKAKEKRVNLLSIVGAERDGDYRVSVAKALRTAGFILIETNDDGETFYLVAS